MDKPIPMPDTTLIVYHKMIPLTFFLTPLKLAHFLISLEYFQDFF